MNGDTNLIDISMLQQLQDQFCCADHLYLMCVDDMLGDAATLGDGTDTGKARVIMRNGDHREPG